MAVKLLMPPIGVRTVKLGFSSFFRFDLRATGIAEIGIRPLRDGYSRFIKFTCNKKSN